MQPADALQEIYINIKLGHRMKFLMGASTGVPTHTHTHILPKT
jgi:hypothetical protein